MHDITVFKRSRLILLKSYTSNSIDYICNLYGLHKYDLQLMSYSKIKGRVLGVVMAGISEEDLMKEIMIQELLSMHDSNDTAFRITFEENNNCANCKYLFSLS